MADELNTDTRARRAASQSFRSFYKPRFGVCLRMDKRHEAFCRGRKSGRARVHGAVLARMTVLRDDGSFGLATLRGLHSTMDGGVAGQ